MRRDGEEVAPERLHVDRPVRRGLRGVDDHDRALPVRPGDELLDRVDRAERVRDESGRDDLDAALRRDAVELVEPELAVVVDRDRAEARAGPARDVLPRDEVRVVLQLADDDEVALAQVVEPPGVGDEIQRLGGLAREDHLALRGRVHERRHLRASTLVRVRRALGEPVDAAMHVRVGVRVELDHGVEHLARLLRRGRRVEEGDRLPVHELLEVGKIGAQALRIELRRGGHGHAPHRIGRVPPASRAGRPCRSSPRARRSRARARRPARRPPAPRRACARARARR